MPLPCTPEYNMQQSHMRCNWMTQYYIITFMCSALLMAYSRISDSGHSEIRTISLQRTQLEVPRYFLSIVPIHFEPPKEGNLLTKDKKMVLKCSLFGDSTVYHNTQCLHTYIHTYTYPKLRNFRDQ